MGRKNETMAQKAKIIVTGSSRGSRTAWLTSLLLLRLYGVRAEFFHPQKWNKETAMAGLLLTGGKDIDPYTFKEKRHPSILSTDPSRDAMELFLLERAIDEGIPVLGICRGMQLINLFLGGTLHPHIPEIDLQYSHPHTVFPKNQLTIVPNTHLYTILKTNSLKVNALHHQSIQKVADTLQVCAYDRNNLVQAIESKDKRFILGLQWHPEFMPYARSTHRIFASFCDKTKHYYNEHF
jgi:putative glutamine amidotransferase